MHTLKFECEVVTPMFLAGADGITPELRAPSIKGAMRFWWRAMNGHLSIDKLREKEAEIFGGSGEKEGKSKVSIRINSTQIKKSETLWEEIGYDEKTAKKSGKKYKIPKKENGIAYLLYSVFMLTERPYIKSDSKFEIIFTSFDEEALKKAINSFKILSIFGGLGSRVRRGAGSFVVTKGLENNFYGQNIKTPSELKNYIEGVVKPLLKGSQKPCKHSVLKNAKIYIFEPKENWKKALESIGEPFADFRQNHKDRIIETPMFGFPIRHRNKSLFGAAPDPNKKDRKGNVVDFLERRASPLVFKVIKTEKNCFIPVILRFNDKFIPNNYKITDKKGQKFDNPNNRIIDEFFNDLKTNIKEEVEL